VELAPAVEVPVSDESAVVVPDDVLPDVVLPEAVGVAGALEDDGVASGVPSELGVGAVLEDGAVEDDGASDDVPLPDSLVPGWFSLRGSPESVPVPEVAPGDVPVPGSLGPAPGEVERPDAGGITASWLPSVCGGGGGGVPSDSGAFGSVGVPGGVSDTLAARNSCCAAR
jgi:hypothetical protein